MLGDRQPPWLAEFASAIEAIYSEDVWELFLSGLIARPTSVAWMRAFCSPQRVPEAVRRDPGFVDVVLWPMLRDEDCLRSLDFARHRLDTWHMPIAEGLVERTAMFRHQLCNSAMFTVPS